MTDEQRPRNRRFRWIVGALAVAAVVSGGAAYAATKDDSPQARSQAIVEDAAGTLGVDPAKLSDALKQALQKQVDAQVTAGNLTKEQADAIKKRIEDGTQPIFGGPGFGGPGKHFGHGCDARLRARPGLRRHALAAGVEELATYLGLEPAGAAHPVEVRQVARRHRQGAGQDGGRPQDGDHRRSRRSGSMPR